MPADIPQLILFTTLGCHLCEQAKTQLWQAQAAVQFEFSEQDIALCNDLVASYGARIPVVRDKSSGRELDWPFTADAIKEMLKF